MKHSGTRRPTAITYSPCEPRAGRASRALLGAAIAVLLVAAFVHAGTISGMFAVAGAIVIHVAASIRPGPRRPLGRVLRPTLIAVTLFALAPAFVRPLRVRDAAACARSGEHVYLCTGPLARPHIWHRGALIAYFPDPARPTLALDRVVALPGEHAAFRRGRLFIDGLPAPVALSCPARASRLPEFEFDVPPEGAVGVLPLSLDLRADGPGAPDAIQAALRRYAVVRNYQIVGRVWYRLTPLRRCRAM